MQYIDIQKHEKYMKNYDKSKESSYIKYLDAKNFHEFAKILLSQKLPVDGFKWKKTLLSLMKSL